MSFDMKDYKEVPERIAEFAAKYPEGSLQGDGYFVRDVEEKIVGYHYVAKAYRTPDDPRPGVGTAYEKIPGSTPYTKDSEVMNAETSAWGRAIVALGFSTKKIASVEEVRARQGSGEPKARQTPSGGAEPVSQAVAQAVEPASPENNFTPPPPKPPPADGGEPSEVVLTFGAHKDKKLGDLMAGSQKERGYVEWLAGPEFEPQTATARRVKGAAVTILGGIPEPVGAGNADNIPFMPTIDGAV